MNYVLLQDSYAIFADRHFDIWTSVSTSKQKKKQVNEAAAGILLSGCTSQYRYI